MKKKLLYLLLLFSSGIASAQIVNIPDAYFKNKLLSANFGNGVAKGSDNMPIVIDVSADGEIQESEALLVYSLDVNNSDISDLSGIEAFLNLEHLDCANNNLVVLDVSFLSNLELLACASNAIADLNVSGLINLEVIGCGENNLTSLDLTGLISLNQLYCDENQIAVLDLTSCPDIEFADCSHNQLTSIDVSGLNSLTVLSFDTNLLESLSIQNLVSLENLNISNNPIIELNLSGLPNFIRLFCTNTSLVNLDLSNCELQYIVCTDNGLLETINLKNGGLLPLGDDMLIDNNPLLNFICIDEGEEEVIEQALGPDNDPAYSSYCSFTPGGNYNTIRGTVIYDANNDGCEDNVPYGFLKIYINDGANEGYAFTNNEGEYVFYTDAGNFTITPVFENGWFTATPASANVVFPDVNNNVHVENFCITSTGNHPDLEVVMEPISTARPGFDAQYKVVYRNKGNQVLSGSVNCGWDYSILTGVAISPLPDGIVPGIYTWNFTDLMPFESREIVMTLNVNSPTDTPAVNPGDVLPFTAAITAIGTDETPEDNAFAFDQVVVGSLDPNSITCIQGATAPTTEIGEYLHYVVDFENIGDAAATFVVVKHEINPEDFDVSSLQVLNSSHPMIARVTGNKVEFIFDNINLSALEHGNILFKLKSLNTLEEGDSVVNQADIFFDYNHPLATNEATTVFEIITSGLGEFEVDNSVKIYPIPAQNHVTIEADSNIESVSLFDAQGRVLQTSLVSDRQVVLDMSSRQSGIYFLKVTTAEGVKVQQVIKK